MKNIESILKEKSTYLNSDPSSFDLWNWIKSIEVNVDWVFFWTPIYKKHILFEHNDRVFSIIFNKMHHLYNDRLFKKFTDNFKAGEY